MGHSKAYTLIELLVVAGVVVMFSGVALATYNSFSARKNLDAQAQRLFDTIELAKQKAQTSDQTATCTSPTTLFEGYEMRVNTSSYDFRQCCKDPTAGTISCNSIGPVLGSYTFPGSIYTVAAGTGSIQFRSLGRGTNLGGVRTIRIRNSALSGNQCMLITVSPNGVVNLNNTLVSCT